MPAQDDYYRLLGVSADADRDEIRDAYRARRDAIADEQTDETQVETARLNRAWNVLSDPVQRERYDAELAEAKASDDWVESDIEVVDGESAPAAADGKRMSYREARQQMKSQQAQRSAPGAVIAGVTLPPPRRRLFAFLIDLVIVAGLTIAGYTYGASVSQDRYPVAYRELGAAQREDVRLGILDDLRGAEADLADAQEENDADAISSAEDDIADAKQRYQEQLDDLDQRIEDASDADDRAALEEERSAAATEQERFDSQDAIEERRDELGDTILEKQEDVSGPILQWMMIGAGAALLVCVVPSTITGRTVGKALFKLRLVRENGAKAGFGGSFVHYGLPIVFVLLVLLVTGFGLAPIALAIGVFGVTSFVRNPRQQGWHDRIAHTLVVQD